MELRGLLAAFEKLPKVVQEGDADHWIASLGAVSAAALQQLQFDDLLLHLKKQGGDLRQARSHINHWFDGFRTMRLIHLLCDSWLCRGEPEEIMSEYFSWAGLACPETLVGMLEELRHYEET